MGVVCPRHDLEGLPYVPRIILCIAVRSTIIQTQNCRYVRCCVPPVSLVIRILYPLYQVRMLQQVPDVGEQMAVAIAAHYPLPRDLVRAFSDPSVPEEQRAVLLADKMGSRKEWKRARRVFDLFTQEDGDFELT